MRKYLLILGFSIFTLFNTNAQETTPLEVYVDEDFNTGGLPSGWTNANISGSENWVVRIDGSNALAGGGGFAGDPGNNNIDGTRLLVFDDDSLGLTKSNNTPAVETGSFDNSLPTATYLEFDYNFRSAKADGLVAGIDSMAVEVYDGTNWNLVFSETENNCGQYKTATGALSDCDKGSFPHAKVNISAYKNANCKVRFVYHDADNWAFYAAVDNVVIYSPQENDIDVARVVSPQGSCGLSAAEKVQVLLFNTGAKEATNYDVTININEGDQIITENFTDTIAPQGLRVVEFATTSDFSLSKLYSVQTIVVWNSDTLNYNDTSVTVFRNDTIYTDAYFDSFEDVLNGSEWTSSGDSMQWEWGFPAGKVISSARGGNFAWMTKLNEPYSDNDLINKGGSVLSSPCFDFTDALGDPIVSFDLFMHITNGGDQLRLQTSIDDGQTWQEVNRSGIAQNWYNSIKKDSWARNSSGWIRVENVLKGLAGESQVKMRFVFSTDSPPPGKTTNEDGAAIDQFRIELPDSVNLTLAQLNYPVQGFTPECGYGFENIDIRIANRGANPVDTFIIGYQVDNNPVEKDTIFDPILVNTLRDYTFKTPADLSNRGGTYKLAVWVEALGDGSTHNDTLDNIRIDNVSPASVITPLKANFDNWTPGSELNNANDLIKDGWIRTNPGSNTTWRVANSGNFTDANTGPNQNHTVGNPSGNFIYIETTEGDSGNWAVVETPCVDFSDKDAVQLDFWYYRFGGLMGSLVIDVFDGVRWIDSVHTVPDRPQIDKNSPWSPRSVNLNQFAGKKIKVRFKGQKLDDNGGGGNSGDMAIDDVVLYEPTPNDVELIDFISPISDCNIGANSEVSLRLWNFGTGTIPADSLIMTVVYYPKDDPFLADTLIDTVRRAIDSKDTILFKMGPKADVIGNGVTYEFNAWSTLATDRNYGNDTLFKYEATNYTQLPGYVEKFESFDFIDGNCLNHYNDFISKGWSTGNSVFNWNVQDARTCLGPNGATASFGTGPLGDHTNGEGRFLYTESTLAGGVAELISPCIDFTGSTGAAMAFWYHMFGAQMGKLYIDVFANGQWDLAIDSLVGQQQVVVEEPWRVKGVNLGNYADDLIQVRFRATRIGPTGDIALDDIEFFEPIPQDARISEVITPVTECSPAGIVKVAVENFGTDSIKPNTVVLHFRSNGGQIFTDTLPKGIGVGDSVQHTFAPLGDFSSQVNTTFNLFVWTDLDNDINVFNDTLLYRLTNITQSIAYVENFESFRDGGCAAIGDLFTRGWESDPSQLETPIPAHWNVQNAAACGGTPAQGVGAGRGPQADGTIGGRGNFMYLQTLSNITAEEASLYTPCLDFQNETSAGMIFDYHILGTGSAKLFIEVMGNNGWEIVDSLVGNHQSINSDPWIEHAVKFEEYAGQEIQIRFRGISPRTDVIAIDDVSFYLPQEKDARMNGVLTPVSGCELFENSVITVEVENFGTTKIDKDSLMVFYQVDNLTPVGERIPDSLGIDSTYEYVFSATADFSAAGEVFNIKTWTSLANEQNVRNDTVFQYFLFNETKRTNYFEDFEGFKDANCLNNVGQATNNGWVIYSTGAFSWNVQNSLCNKNDVVTFTDGTGPDGDHTTGEGMFLYTEASDNGAPDVLVGGTTFLESPCIDLAPNAKTHLSFWYHRYGQNVGTLTVEVLSNGVWDAVSTPLTGDQHNSADANWNQMVVDLSAYTGERILIRFRADAPSGIRGDMAIDDILLYEPSNVDVGIVNIVQPDIDGCAVGDRNVIVQVKNYGLQKIDSGDVAMEYAIRGDVTYDTVKQAIDSGQTLTYTFGDRIKLADYSGVQIVTAAARLAGDTISDNNTAYKEVVNRQPGFPRWFSDFENHSTSPLPNPRPYGLDDLQGWRRNMVPVAPNGYGWHVECNPAPNSAANLFLPPGPPTGPDGDHTYSVTERNGDGCYLLIESALRPAPFIVEDAIIELPCGDIDFTKSKNGKILLSFWYHMYGSGMGDLFIDVNNGRRWLNGIDVIRGQQQFEPTERWKRFQVVLDSFATNDDMKIRFRADFIGEGGDIAIDDVELLDRAKKDARIDRIADPASDCDLSNAEDFRVRFQNVGTEDILETRMAYQVTYTPYSCKGETVRSVTDTIVRDTAVGPNGFAAPLAFQTFEFDAIDLSAPGRYDFKIWTEIVGDVNFFNDTLYETVLNETRAFNCCEDFSDMTFGQRGGQFRDGKFPNAWDGNTNAYTFKVDRFDGGVTQGHTGRNNDNFLLANDPDGMPGQVARIESPCFDLTNANAAILEFWYQAPSTNHFMLVEAQTVNAGGWTILDTIKGEGLFGVRRWTKNTQVLTNFIGGFVKIRFRAVNIGDGYYAIDDLCVKAPPPQQIDLEKFVTPARGRCSYTDNELITLRFQNVGLDRITKFKIVINVDSANQNFPAGKYLTDTFDVVINSNPFFEPGQKIDIALDLPHLYVDLLTPGIYYFNAKVLLDGDLNEENNIITDYPINNVIPIEIPYIEDFELVRGEGRGVGGAYTNGFVATANQPFYFWEEENRLEIFRDGLTGPIYDHTKDSEEGTYMITNAVQRSLGNRATLTTRCVDLRDAINPEIKYWYHMFGFQMGELYLQINDDNGWVTIDSLLGADRDQRTHRSEWKSRSVSLTKYAGTVSRFRFRSYRGGGSASSMAIDDISVVDLAAKDLSPVSLDDPTNDTMSCYSAQQKVCINIRNNGSQSFDFTQDSTEITVLIQKSIDSLNWNNFDTLYATITTHMFEDVSGARGVTPRDSIVTICMPETFDMSDTGFFFRFIVDVFANGDVINRNDRYQVDVKSQIVGGFTTLSADPKNRSTICFGTNVQLETKDYFGAISWEEKRILPDGSGIWLPGIFRPNDERTYLPAPDTSTYFRVRVCQSGVVSDSFKIEVIKPSPPRAMDFSICGDSSVQVNDMPLRYGAVVQDFISGVNAYDSAFQSIRNGAPIPPGFFVFPANFDMGDGDPDTLIRTRLGNATDTAYLESFVQDPRVDNGFNQGKCYSVSKTRVISTINTPPEPKFAFGTDSVCQDTALLLDAGRVKYAALDEDGNTQYYKTSYAWTIYLPDGTVVDTNSNTRDSAVLRNQTMVVDAYLLNLNQTYGYSVSIRTDSGCAFNTNQRLNVTVTDSCITSIEEVALKENLEIYPNPVSEELFIRHQSSENFTGSIKLMSVEGQIIEAFDKVGFGNLNQRIDMGVLPKGIYIIKIETEKGSFVKKIIKS